MNREELLAAWRREEQEPFSGWDFSHLAGRMIEDPHPWSYAERAAALLDDAAWALDLDTGGGERLLALRLHWPKCVVATEAHAPNVKLAGRRLGTAGARVVAAVSRIGAALPFRDASFDLLLNRHGGFDPLEVGRVLRPRGTFFSEQVHGLWAHDLLAVFGLKPPAIPGALERELPLLRQAGLEIVDARDWTGRLIFTDVGAVAYYLKAVPWLVPGFGVETHAQALFGLQERLEREGRLVFSARLYLIEARRAAGR